MGQVLRAVPSPSQGASGLKLRGVMMMRVPMVTPGSGKWSVVIGCSAGPGKHCTMGTYSQTSLEAWKHDSFKSGYYDRKS